MKKQKKKGLTFTLEEQKDYEVKINLFWFEFQLDIKLKFKVILVFLVLVRVQLIIIGWRKQKSFKQAFDPLILNLNNSHAQLFHVGFIFLNPIFSIMHPYKYENSLKKYFHIIQFRNIF